MTNQKSTQLNIANFNHEITIHTHGQQDLVSNIILREKIWEAYETELMINALSSGDTVLDIGANIGYYSLIAGKHVGVNGKVFSFEPENRNFQLLQKNIQNNNLHNVTSFNQGLGEKPETIDLFTHDDNYGDHRAFNFEKNRQKTSIDIITGDQIAQNLDVSLIKIDTQGYEHAILKGLRDTLKRNQHQVTMILEFWPFALEQNHTSAEALLNEISQYEFNIHVIDHINHQLQRTTLDELRDLTATKLLPKHQGFINLWLSPRPKKPSRKHTSDS